MTESRKKTCGRIQATKHWLTRAEKHFGQDASVRGEMDLLLAEAELRSTREKVQPSRRRSLWLQHGLALGVALILMAGGLGGAWLFWRDAAVKPAAVVKPPAAVEPQVAPALQPPVLPAAPAQNVEEAPPAAAVLPLNHGQEVNSGNKPVVRDTPVSPDEMKRLVRTAGQSLRGQPKP